MSSGIGVEIALPSFLHRSFCCNAPASVTGPVPSLTLESEAGLSFSLEREPLSQEHHALVPGSEEQELRGRHLVTVGMESQATL